MKTVVEINGSVKPGYEALTDAFERALFLDGDGGGAGFSVYVAGEQVAWLWGGEAEPGVPWQADTLCWIASVTKAVTALAATMLADRGLLDVDAPVASYWPEFAQAGKAELPVSMILDHTIALPTFPNYRDVVSTDEPHGYHNLEEIVARIAAAEPMRVPGAQHGYSSKTYGWMVGELVRRITGETLGTFVRKEIAEPLGLDLWVGLPESEHDRVAPMIPDPTMDAETMQGQTIASQTIMGQTFFMGDKLLGTAIRETMNHPVFWTAEVPGGGGMATAQSLSRLFGCLACGGDLDSVRLVSDEALRRHTERRVHGPDAVWGSIFSFGLGFMRPTETLAFGPHDEAFGHPGMGGAVGYADPVERVGFGFIPNRMIKAQRTDPRWEILGDALYRCLT